MKKNSFVLFIAFLIMAFGSSRSINSPSPSEISENEVLIQKEDLEKVKEGY